MAGYIAFWIMKQDTGTPRMREISNAIKAGAEAYLGRQYRTISIIAIIATVLMAIAIRDPANPWLGVDTAAGFLLGCGTSRLSIVKK